MGGSNDESQALASAEAYDQATGTWSPAGNMAQARGFHTAVLLADGRVLVTGGDGEPGSPIRNLASAELYDPSAGTWSPVASMTEARRDHRAMLLYDGTVLVVGGRADGGSTDSVEIYDASTDTWSSVNDMIEGRSDHAVVLLADGRVLTSGGFPPPLRVGVWDSAEVYDPIAGTWSPAGNMTEPRRDYTATLLLDSRVLIVGGNSVSGDLASAEVYDPLTNTWSLTSSMIQPRFWNFTATLLTDGRVLVVGGGFFTPLASAEVYDPSTGTWSSGGSLTDARRSDTATLLDDGRVLVLGGRDDESQALSSAEVYDPATDTWLSAAETEP